MNRTRGLSGALVVSIGALAWLLGEDPGGKPAAGPRAPLPLTARGSLTCLAEEMKDRWKAEVPPVHDHIPGFKLEAPAEGAPAFYTLLRTPLSEALFKDKRFTGRTLELTGRVFPGTAILEVARFRWLKEGKLEEVYYWCEVCSIRGVNPGPCACCQGEVELREEPVKEGTK